MKILTTDFGYDPELCRVPEPSVYLAQEAWRVFGRPLDLLLLVRRSSHLVPLTELGFLGQRLSVMIISVTSPPTYHIGIKPARQLQSLSGPLWEWSAGAINETHC